PLSATVKRPRACMASFARAARRRAAARAAPSASENVWMIIISPPASSWRRPRPVADLGHVFEMLPDIDLVPRQHGRAEIGQGVRPPVEARRVLQRVQTDVIAAHAVL